MSRISRRIRPTVDAGADAVARLDSAPGGRADAVGSERSGDTRIAGYRMLRRIASGDRADVYLATADRAASTEGDAATLVALRIYDRANWNESIAIEIEAMSTDTSGTLPALYDVATLDDGRCCLAVERIAGAPASRLIAERTLTAGEAVTLLAPLVAATGEIGRLGFVHTRLSLGDVLIDEQGRPRLVGLGALERLSAHDAAARTALLRRGHQALAELVDDVVAATRPAGVLDTVAEMLRARLAARPFATCEEELERALFAAAQPTPIAGIVLRTRPAVLPARATLPMAPGSLASAAGLVETDEHDVESPRRGGALRALLALVGLPVADEPSGATDDQDHRSLLTRVRRAASARRRPLMFAGLIGGGALVLLLTLVPPATAGGEPNGAASHGTGGERARLAPIASDAEGTPIGGSVPDTSTTPPIPATDGAVDAPGDPASAAAELLELRSSCFAALDLACLDHVVQEGSAIEAEDRAAMVAARDGRPPELADFDLGGVAVRAEMGAAVLVTVPYAEAEREPASVLVMRSEAGWRLRELFD